MSEPLIDEAEVGRLTAGLPTVYVSIGNTRMRQPEWSTICIALKSLVYSHATAVHGWWFSEPASSWQSCCMCFEVTAEMGVHLRAALRSLAGAQGQPSIRWAEAATTLLRPSDPLTELPRLQVVEAEWSG